jgi:hypothetical protein
MELVVPTIKIEIFHHGQKVDRSYWQKWCGKKKNYGLLPRQ